MDRAIDIKRRAQRCIQAGDLDGALAEYEKLIAADDSDPYNFVLLADLLYKKGDHENASRRYLVAATAYEQAGLYKNAIAVGKKMMRLSLSPGLVLDRLASLHALDGLATEATLYYQQYAEHQVRENRLKEAAAALRKAFEACPDNIKALERLAEVHTLADELPEAARALAEAAEHYARVSQTADAERCRARAEQIVPGAVADFARQAPTPPAPAAVPRPALAAPRSALAPEPGLVGTPPTPPTVRRPEAGTATDSAIVMEALPRETGAPDSRAAGVDTERPPVFVPPSADAVRDLEVDRHVHAPARTPDRGASSPPGGSDGPAPDATAPTGASTPLPDSLEAVEGMLTEAQKEFRAGNRESAAKILVRAARAYEALQSPDNAVSIYRSLCKGPHGTTEVVELWFANCEMRDDRREGSSVACDLGDRAIQDNDLERARSWFVRALKLDPNNSVASRRLERLSRPSAAALPAPDVQEIPRAGAPEPEPQAAPPPPAPAAAEPPPPVAAEEPVAASAPPSEDGKGEDGRIAIALDRTQAVSFDFSAMLAEFQRGVETQISGDTQAHYDLAVAYREMGLVEQAIEAFRLAAKDPAFRQRCAEMIGFCLLEVGQFEEAARELAEALADPGLTPQAAVGIRFELGLALEAGGRGQDALAEFERVFEIDANYPGVAQKIRGLRKSLEAA